MAYKCPIKVKQYMAAYYRNNKAMFYKSARATKIKLRVDILIGYGGHCVCCGENQEEFLALDHVNNDGASERRNGLRTEKLYAMARREGYPSKYQLLCHNCNFAKSLRGGCPHGNT